MVDKMSGSGRVRVGIDGGEGSSENFVKMRLRRWMAARARGAGGHGRKLRERICSMRMNGGRCSISRRGDELSFVLVQSHGKSLLRLRTVMIEHEAALRGQRGAERLYENY